MTLHELNQRFGAPGRIVFKDGFAGFPNVVLANRYGNAEVALLGAAVLSYRPTGIGQVLFRPAKTDGEYNVGDGFHGGIPLCWPQFGNRMTKTLAQHGFARQMLFEVRASEYSEEKTEVKLGLKSNDDTRKLWSYEFDLEVTITVSMKLNLAVCTKNTGKEPFEFSVGFHPYYLVRERNSVTVKGLDGCDFVDGTTPALAEGTQVGDIAVVKGYDHIFGMPSAAKHEVALLDAGLKRAIAMVSSGNTKTVVWNPDTEYVAGEQSADDWHKFVCVEPVSNWPSGNSLKPGESHELLAAIQAHLEG